MGLRFVVLSLALVAGCARPTPPTETLTIGDLREMFPVPRPAAETAWRLSGIEAMERAKPSPDAELNRKQQDSLRESRQSIAKALQKLDGSQRATAQFIGERLPYYSVDDLNAKVLSVPEYLVQDSILFDTAIRRRRMKEYLQSIGPDEFKRRHPKIASYADDPY